MTTVFWHLKSIPKFLCSSITLTYQKWKLTFYTLTYNHFMDQSYAADVCMGPMFWIVDNFTNTIGTLLVISVVALTASVVLIAYWIGLPYWWERNYIMCIFLVIFGNWLLLNIAFHYYMAVFTHPGFPPEGEMIFEAVSICKKCISPKPPRTHHCSVCNRCILKMDHHCPWLNNCVGYRNHRFFFLYMVYMVAGVLFVILAGFDLAYNIVIEQTEPDLIGHSVKVNQSGSFIPVTQEDSLDLEESHGTLNPWRRKAVIYMALINLGVLLALGALACWHAQLITRGETSIEANINRAETTRLAEFSRVYKNPYNFGSRKNWILFLGLVHGRTFVRHILLPSTHEPEGDGLSWHTIHDTNLNEWP